MAKVHALDTAIGNLIEKIDLTNTIIVFSSDNGGQPNHGGNNWPYRGQKGTFFEGGVKVPGFIFPRENFHHLEDSIVHVSDWLPTLLGFCGCKKNVGSRKLDGMDLNISKRKEILHNIDPMNKFTGPIDFIDWNLKQESGFNIRVSAGYRKGKYKIITGKVKNSEWTYPPELQQDKTFGRKRIIRIRRSKVYRKLREKNSEGIVRLYDTENDPLEKINLARSTEKDFKYRFITLMMLNRLKSFNTTAVPVRYPPIDEVEPVDGFWLPWRDEL